MKQWLLRLNLFQRLLLYIFVIIVSSLALVSITTYIKASEAIEDQVSVYLDQIVNTVNYQIDSFLVNYELSTLPMVTDSEIREFMDNNYKNDFELYLNQVEIEKQMDRMMTSRPDIEQIYFMEESGKYITGRDKRNQISIPDFYEDLNAKTPDTGKIVIYPRMSQNDFVITMARKIRGTKTYIPKGIIAFDLNASSLTKTWDAIQLEEGSFFLIVGKNGEIIYHPDSDFLGSQIAPNIMKKVMKTTQNRFYETWNDKETFFYYDTSSYTGWTVMLAVPNKTLFEPISIVRKTVFLSGILALVIALFLAQHFIRKIVKPIRMIERTMKNVEKGDWELAPEVNGEDEISSLVRNYNKMVYRLSSLVEQVYKAELETQKGQLKLQMREIEKQKVELQALQSQINPHFLYNTLGTINSYAVIKEMDEISEMTNALANMFRYSLQNLEVVSIQDELSHVRDFLLIQEHRWQKNIPLLIEIEANLLHAKIVKLSLQPLVENAIEHGFQTITGESKIIIKSEVCGDVLYLSVEDNGIGMNESRLMELRSLLDREQLHPMADQGIGILNVTKRTKLLFGKEYGIEIFSESNKGTKVRMSVPYEVGTGNQNTTYLTG
jgi:two-component system, sensor histidine kinase YesM